MPSNSCVVGAAVEQVFGVLSDYANYPMWAPDVVSATILAREGDIVVAEFCSPFLTDKKYVVEFLHGRPSSIVYKQVDQFGERGVQGEWRLERAPDGSETTVHGSLLVRAEMTKTLLNRRRAGLVLQRRLDSLRELFAPAAAGPPAARRGLAADPVVEAVAKGEAAVVCWQGSRYVLTKSER